MSNIQSKFLVALTAVAACFAWSTDASAQDSKLISRAVSLTQTGGPLLQSIGNTTAANLEVIGSNYADRVSIAVRSGNLNRVDALVRNFRQVAAEEAREGMREGRDSIAELTQKLDRLIRVASRPGTILQINLYREILVSAHDNAQVQIRDAYKSARDAVLNAANGN